MNSTIASGIFISVVVGIFGGCLASTIWSLAAFLDRNIASPIPKRQVSDQQAAWPALATWLACSWILLSLLLPVMLHVISPAPKPAAEFTMTQVLFLVAQNTIIMLFLLLAIDPRRFRAVGIISPEPVQDLISALWATPLMLTGAAILRISLSPWIKPEDSHPILKMLSFDSPWINIVLLLFTAAIVAPLFEELLFRVILQGWLTRLLGRNWSIPLVAIAFAAVHGWPDAVPLLLVGFMLGILFDRRRSWLSVVALHSFFNATMLIMQVLAVNATQPAAPEKSPVPEQQNPPISAPQAIEVSVFQKAGFTLEHNSSDQVSMNVRTS